MKTDPQVKAFWSTSIAAGALALLHQLVQAQLAPTVGHRSGMSTGEQPSRSFPCNAQRDLTFIR